jgi:hypothetical protein
MGKEYRMVEVKKNITYVVCTLQGEYPSRNVWINKRLLDPKPSQKLRNHSPDGFNWGYGGSGPAQLALAIMLDQFGSPECYQDLKWQVISKIPQGKDFRIDLAIHREIEDGCIKIFRTEYR